MSRHRAVSVLGVFALLGVTAMARAQAGDTPPAASEKPTPPAATAKQAPATSSATMSHSSTAAHHAEPKLDLNRASREELMKLPGVGETAADKIIASRPLKSKHDLVTKKIVSEKEYQTIAAHVMVKQEPTSGKSASK